MLDRKLDLHSKQFLKEPAEQPVNQLTNVVFVNESELHIELGKLRLAVSTEILVSHATNNLVVAVETGNHEQLLEKLGRLRKRVEPAGMNPGWNQEIPRALGSTPSEERRLEIEKIMFLQHLTNDAGHPGSKDHILLNTPAA